MIWSRPVDSQSISIYLYSTNNLPKMSSRPEDRSSPVSVTSLAHRATLLATWISLVDWPSSKATLTVACARRLFRTNFSSAYNGSLVSFQKDGVVSPVRQHYQYRHSKDVDRLAISVVSWDSGIFAYSRYWSCISMLTHPACCCWSQSVVEFSDTTTLKVYIQGILAIFCRLKIWSYIRWLLKAKFPTQLGF